MAIYRNVQISFWTDTKVSDEFTPEDKYFYLYLFTNPHTNLCGCYEINFKQMSDETGYSKDSIERLIDRFQNYHKVILYDKDYREIILLNWYKYNWTSSEKFLCGLEKSINSIKNEKFRKYLLKVKNGDNKIEDLDNQEKIKQIIKYLNDRCGTQYRNNSKTTQKHIIARIREGYTNEDFYTVIDKKSNEWIGTEQEKYLRPETLFGNKFESYLNQHITIKSPRQETDEWINKWRGV